jgi:hypothetical protein
MTEREVYNLMLFLIWSFMVFCYGVSWGRGKK